MKDGFSKITVINLPLLHKNFNLYDLLVNEAFKLLLFCEKSLVIVFYENYI